MPSTTESGARNVMATPSITRLSRGCARTQRTCCRARRIERRAIRVGAAGKPGVDEESRMQRAQHRRRAADVIGVRMRQHEHVERTAAPPDVRNDGRSSRVAAAPRTAGVEQNPVRVRRAQRDRVALPHVDHVQLDVA